MALRGRKILRAFEKCAPVAMYLVNEEVTKHKTYTFLILNNGIVE